MIIPDEVKRLARAGKVSKIHVIALLRAKTGIGLAEAKAIVDTLTAGGEVQLATPASASPSGETPEQRIQRQLDAICTTGRASVLKKEEIGKLLEIFAVDEDLLDLAQGTYYNYSGVLVATQRRLLFMNEEMVDGPEVVEEFLLDNIYLAYHKAGLQGSSIKIFMSGNDKAEFSNVEKDVALAFVKALRPRIMFRCDEFDQLEARDQLEQVDVWYYEMGILSKEEFDDRKKRILDRIARSGGQ